MKQWLVFLSLLIGVVFPTWATIHIQDVIGRKVVLDKPAERLFLGFYFEDYLAIAGPDSYQKVAIFPRHSWKDYRQSQWQTYSKIIPELETITDSGSIYTGTFDFEKLLPAHWVGGYTRDAAQQVCNMRMPVSQTIYNQGRIWRKGGREHGHLPPP